MNALLDLAMCTGKYWTIRVSPIPKDWVVTFDALTGLHAVQTANGLHAHVGYLPSRGSGEDAQGWLGYFKTTRGVEKTVYLTVEEIEEQSAKDKDAREENARSQGRKERNIKKQDVMQREMVLAELLRGENLCIALSNVQTCERSIA
jgi:hypothetical protein